MQRKEQETMLCYIIYSVHANVKGVEKMRKTKNRVGETNTANCGMKMTIIRYGSSYDIDVEFEDGTIVKNRTYRCFKRGMISHPNYYLANRLGESELLGH